MTLNLTQLFVPAVCSVSHKEISRVYRQSSYDLKKRKCPRKAVSMCLFSLFACFFGSFLIPEFKGE